MGRDNISGYDLDRFIKAQDGFYGSYATALSEISKGRKKSHWIWYIFPQVKGLGRSYESKYYGLDGLEEAKAYLEHPVLGERLREITTALLRLERGSAVEILGVIDAMKVKSCMTLFELVAEDDVFGKVLDKYYDGQRCSITLRLRD